MAGRHERGILKGVALMMLICMSGFASLGAQTIRGSGRVVEESRQVHGFNRVKMAGVGTLCIHKGDEEALRIQAEDNLIGYIESQVVDRTLVIAIRKVATILQPTRPIKFDLWVKELQGIQLSGAANIHAPNLNVDEFVVTVTGKGNVEMPDLHAKNLVVQVTGAGNMIISGDVDEQEVTIQGKGEYKAGHLASTKATILITGKGQAELHVHNELDAAVTGFGVIRYYGEPERVKKNVTGKGTIARMR